MNPKDLFGNDHNTFCEQDPFNLKNTVEGFISRKANEYYGALIITKVNDKEVTPQLIMGTPKIRYPFWTRADGTRNYTFPSVQTIEMYEKLDGTNILAFSYFDYYGYRYVSYKTRLRPFAGSGRFGNFKDMWIETAKPYLEQINELMIRKDCNLSFELYGTRNPILVLYKVPLAIALLFGITNTGRILSPIDLEPLVMPTVPLLQCTNKDYVCNYEQMQKDLQNTLKKVEDYYTGKEGAVWYLKTSGKCLQFKCKPETIEAIHFSGAGVSKNSILTTCWNAFENVDKLTVEFVKQLLLEEFDHILVEDNLNLIEKCIDIVEKELRFRGKVLEEYKKLGKNILLEKAIIMRELSTKFARNEMKKVYSTVVNFG